MRIKICKLLKNIACIVYILVAANQKGRTWGQRFPTARIDIVYLLVDFENDDKGKSEIGGCVDSLSNPACIGTAR